MKKAHLSDDIVSRTGLRGWGRGRGGGDGGDIVGGGGRRKMKEVERNTEYVWNESCKCETAYIGW